MKLTFYLKCLIILIFISCGSPSNYPYEFEINETSFIISGEVTLETGQMFEEQIIPLPEYENSYIELKKIPDVESTYSFRIITTLEGYYKHQTTDDDVSWGNLPGNRSLPGVNVGGSGVGSGLLPMRETFWQYGPIRVYQYKKVYALFISLPMNGIPSDLIMTYRGYSNGQRVVISLVGKDSVTNRGDGILINFSELYNH